MPHFSVNISEEDSKYTHLALGDLSNEYSGLRSSTQMLTLLSGIMCFLKFHTIIYVRMVPASISVNEWNSGLETRVKIYYLVIS